MLAHGVARGNRIGGGMVQAFVGSFAKPAVNGNQTITGLGFKPKAVIFWAANYENTTSTNWEPHTHQFLGFTAGVGNDYSVGAAAKDAAATTVTARRTRTYAITSQTYDNTGPQWGEASLASFDNDGFTLNWVATTAFQPQIMFLAIGGPRVRARAVAWKTSASNANLAVTGVGFRPDVALHVSAGNTAVDQSLTHAFLELGAMDKSGNQWVVAANSQHGIAGANTHRYQVTSRAFAQPNLGGGMDSQSSYVSMDADGFTTYFDTSVAVLDVVSLCLAGVKVRTGNFVTSANAGNQAVTGVGFRPKAVFFAGGWNGNQGVSAPAAYARLQMTATDGARSRLVTLYDDDGGTSEANSMWRSDRLLQGWSGTQPLSVAAWASLVSLDADGFTVNWDAANGANIAIPYIAIG